MEEGSRFDAFTPNTEPVVATTFGGEVCVYAVPPLIWSGCPGFVVPIPTLPLGAILIASVEESAGVPLVFVPEKVG